MNSSISQENKQNIRLNDEMSKYSRPSHQGRAFKIELGNNNGPYLSKDVMYSNQKSTYLLAAKQVLQSHKHMSNLMSTLNKQQQFQSKSIRNSSTVQNWFSKCQFLQNQLTYVNQQLRKMSLQKIKLKAQVHKSYCRLIEQNQQLTQAFLPLFKNLLKTIREKNEEENNIFEQRKKQLDSLYFFKTQFLNSIVSCEKRTISTEQFLGIAQKSQSNSQYQN